MKSEQQIRDILKQNEKDFEELKKELTNDQRDKDLEDIAIINTLQHLFNNITILKEVLEE